MKNKVYEEKFQSIFWVCGVPDEAVAHIVSECSKLAQKEYKQLRHGWIAKMLQWKLCEKWGAEKWHIHKPEKILETEECKIILDFPTQTDKILERNWPDITDIEKKSKKFLLIDSACPFDTCIERKEEKNAQIIVSWNMKLQECGKWEK